ncbi:hypothetical protein OAD74_09255 [Alphaproteobacteria bacterium]|nr:hypothetical protein [Alphaproteobacteria bacterium]
MHAQTHKIALRSIETIAAMVQIHIAIGLLAMVIVGLALPPKRIVVNMALVDVSKEEDILTYRLSLAYRAMPLLA